MKLDRDELAKQQFCLLVGPDIKFLSVNIADGRMKITFEVPEVARQHTIENEAWDIGLNAGEISRWARDWAENSLGRIPSRPNAWHIYKDVILGGGHCP